MENKLLTVVVPTYNMERLLDKCLTSLASPLPPVEGLIGLTERLELLEVLVVIDGATDRSSEIARGFQDRYPQMFRVIDKENGNYGSCVNRGLQEAKGKYIKILDADDQFDTVALCKVMTKLKELDVDLVLTDYETIDEEGNVNGTFGFNIPKNTVAEASELLDMGKYMAMHAVIYKTENLRRIGYKQTEGISYTDQEWIFAPMQTVRTFYYMDECLYKYLVGREGQTMDVKALAKNMHQNIMVLRRNIQDYNNLDKNLPTYRYLCGKMKSFVEFIYTQYLFHTDVMDITPLIAFDKEFKTLSPELYAYANTLKGGKLPFVKVWRWFYYKKDHGLNNFFEYRKYRMGIGMR